MKHLSAFNNGNVSLNTVVSDKFLFGFAQYLLQRVKPNSARTYFQKLYAIIHASLRSQNRYVALPRISDLIPHYESEDRTALSAQDLQRLILAYCPHEATKRAFLFACFTGLRISDIRTLNYSHIAISGKDFYIVKRQVKTHGTVKVPLGQYALAMLPPMKDHPPQYDSGNIILPSIFNLMSNSTINNDLRIWAKHAGLHKPLSFHCARHTFASLLLGSKTELFVISKLCGHQHVKTTENYLHLSDFQSRNAILKMEHQLQLGSMPSYFR